MDPSLSPSPSSSASEPGSESPVPSVALYVYLNRNLGDDLMVRTLCGKFPEVQFALCVDWDAYWGVFDEVPNLRLFDSAVEMGKWQDFAQRADAGVYLGGSLFMQPADDWAGKAASDAALLYSKPSFFVMGANFGPYDDAGFADAYREPFARCRAVTLRDRGSCGLFEDVPTVSYAPDLAFSFEAPKRRVQCGQVLFNVVNLSFGDSKFPTARHDQDYVLAMAQLARECLLHGFDVCFLGLCENQGDGWVAGRIMDAMREMPCDMRRVRTLSYRGGNMQECIDAFDESRAVVGTRFHAVVLALLRGVPVLPVCYNPKVDALLDDLAYPARIGLADLRDFDAREAFETLVDLEPVDCSGLVAASDGHFAPLREFLEERRQGLL